MDTPQVMGILNVTPDSFYADSRTMSESDIARRAVQIITEGAMMIDIGACSTRPGSTPVDEETETARLKTALTIVRHECPDAIISVDTFRPDVAKMAVEEYGADIINDISGNCAVACARVPYILTSSKANIIDMMISFAQDIRELREKGIKDIILDPGFGFGKSVDENFAILNGMERLKELGLPILVGVSRKSMIYRTLGCTAEEALNGTTAINTIALLKGASILRVHDVKEAVECVRLTNHTPSFV